MPLNILLLLSCPLFAERWIISLKNKSKGNFGGAQKNSRGSLFTPVNGID